MLLNKLKLIFSEDPLKWSKVTVKALITYTKCRHKKKQFLTFYLSKKLNEILNNTTVFNIIICKYQI